MYWVYILQSTVNNKHYIGFTSNMAERLKKHNSGSNRSTKSGRPWKVVYTEECLDKRIAWFRERQIKKYKGGDAFRKLLIEKNGGIA